MIELLVILFITIIMFVWGKFPPDVVALIQNGMDGFSFFEFGLIGLPLLLIYILYFRYLGYKILPNYKTKNRPIVIDSEKPKWIENFSLGDNMYHLRIRLMSELIGAKIGDWDFEKTHNVSIVSLRRTHPSFITILLYYYVISAFNMAFLI